MENVEIRTATADDAEAILNIYQYYVENTAISFEYETPSADEFKRRIENTLKKYPYLAAVHNGMIVGYAYAGAFIWRPAYDWSAEATIYVARDERRCGVGRKLYEALERELKSMGILNLYACIGYPEEDDEYLTKNSAQFHEHLGFKLAGRFHKCGRKFGRWYDMIWMEKIIGEHR